MFSMGLDMGEAKGSLLADQIVGVNSQLLQVALQTIKTPSDRWQLSEFLAANNTEATRNVYKVSKGCLVSEDVNYTTSKIEERRRALTSNGKVAKLLVVDATTLQRTSDAEGTEMLIQRLVKNRDHAKIIGRISLFCWMGGSVCTTLIKRAELGRLSKSIMKLDKELKGTDKYKNEQYRAKHRTSNERLLAMIKEALDVVIAVGLLNLAPKKVTLHVTGACGFTSSLISCYQVPYIACLPAILAMHAKGALLEEAQPIQDTDVEMVGASSATKMRKSPKLLKTRGPKHCSWAI